jgi:hypothetical protein
MMYVSGRKVSHSNVDKELSSSICRHRERPRKVGIILTTSGSSCVARIQTLTRTTPHSIGRRRTKFLCTLYGCVHATTYIPWTWTNFEYLNPEDGNSIAWPSSHQYCGQSCYSRATVLSLDGRFFFIVLGLDSYIHTMKYIDTPHLLPPWSGNMSKRKTNFVFSPFSLGSMLCPVPCVGVPRNASEGRDRSSTVLLNVFLFYRTYPPRPIWLETACSMK